MEPVKALRTLDVARGWGERVGDEDWTFIEFTRPQPGAPPHAIAVPKSEVHKLAQIAIQAMSRLDRHRLLADLISRMKEPLAGDADEETLAIAVDDWSVGVAADDIVSLSLSAPGSEGGVSFRLEADDARQIARVIRKLVGDRSKEPVLEGARPSHPFLSVAEDIEWLRDEWVGRYRPPSLAELRRGSAALRRLLMEGAIQRAWEHCELPGSPKLVAPHLRKLMAERGHDERHLVVALAGGVEYNGVRSAYRFFRRVRHPQTGVQPEADEGFAVEDGVIRKPSRTDFDPLAHPEYAAVEHEWRSIRHYLEAPGAIRRGIPLSRWKILKYFAIYNGGVHLEKVKNSPSEAALYALQTELDGRVDLFGLDGLHAELLAMGQAIGRSPDTLNLASLIRAKAAPSSSGDRPL